MELRLVSGGTLENFNQTLVQNIEIFSKQHGKDSSNEDLISKKIYPKREVFQWRPTSLLCKRFDIVDPYMGKVRRPFLLACILTIIFIDFRPVNLVQLS